MNFWNIVGIVVAFLFGVVGVGLSVAGGILASQAIGIFSVVFIVPAILSLSGAIWAIERLES